MQMKHLGPSNEELREQGKAFLLSRINMSLYHPLFAGDDIEAFSWGCESRGVSFNRCYQLRRGGEVIAEAASVWGLSESRITSYTKSRTSSSALTLTSRSSWIRRAGFTYRAS